MQRLARVSLAGAALVLLSACAERTFTEPEPPPPPPPPPADTVRRVASVVITAHTDSVLLGDTMTFSAAAVDSTGTVVIGRTVQWQTLAPGVLSVEANGRMRGLRPGRTRIEATVDGVTGGLDLRVVRPQSGWQALSGSCGVWTDGVVYCWDLNEPGDVRLVPRAAAGVRFSSVRSGPRHHCALTDFGFAYCWGQNHTGELGDGTTRHSEQPVRVSGAHAFTMIAPGMLHTCGITEEGFVYCWGDNFYGQLGIPFDSTATCAGIPTHCILTPEPVTTLRFAGIYAGDWHTCGLTPEGEAYCWGRNVYGQLGNGTRGDRQSQPVRVAGDIRFDELALGLDHTCGVTPQRTVYCWGMDTSGAVAAPFELHQVCSVPNQHVAYSCIPRPSRVQLPVPGARVATGDFHSCALDSAGATYCWGYNLKGQIGNGSYGHNQFIREPFRVSSLHFVEIAGGVNTTCALTIDAAAYCWGAYRLAPTKLPTP